MQRAPPAARHRMLRPGRGGISCRRSGSCAGLAPQLPALRCETRPAVLDQEWLGGSRGESAVPNRISTSELGDLKIEELRRELSFIRAGQIRLTAGGGACEGPLDEIAPCVLYAEIVEGRVMKVWHDGLFGLSAIAERQERSTTSSRFRTGAVAARTGRSRTQRPTTNTSSRHLRSSEKERRSRSGRRPFRCPLIVSRRVEAVQCQVRCLPVGRSPTSTGNYKTIEYGWATRLN